jgi:hypothetical protein
MSLAISNNASTREIAERCNLLLLGRINTTGSATLTANTTTTTVTDTNCHAGSFVGLMPTTANAAAESPYIVPASGSFVITHANTATTDRTFKYVLLG